MEPQDSLIIDCADCVMSNTDVCDDCLVTFICTREPGDAVVIPLADIRAMKVLTDAGLVPALRHRYSTG